MHTRLSQRLETEESVSKKGDHGSAVAVLRRSRPRSASPRRQADVKSRGHKEESRASPAATPKPGHQLFCSSKSSERKASASRRKGSLAGSLLDHPGGAGSPTKRRATASAAAIYISKVAERSAFPAITHFGKSAQRPRSDCARRGITRFCTTTSAAAAARQGTEAFASLYITLIKLSSDSQSCGLTVGMPSP